MKKSFKVLAAIGFVSKGLIYVIIGVLSLLAALELGGQSSGTNQALSFLKQQAFGRTLLFLLGSGLVCYSVWMFIQSIYDPEQKGKERQAILKRFGLFTTGLVYTGVAALAFYHLFTQDYTGDQSTSYVQFIGSTALTYGFILIGIILAVQGIVLIRGAFRGGLLDQFNLEGQKHYRLIRAMGKFGFYARAFVVLIIAYFFLRAGFYSGNREIKGIQDAFAFLEQTSWSRLLMILTAVGFIAYGAFFIILSKYRRFQAEESDKAD